MTKTQIFKIFKSRNFRMTRVRELIVTFLLGAKKPFSALQLQNFLIKNGEDVNKTTVYRQLSTFKKLGIIKEVLLSDDALQYEIDTDTCQHHLICQKCGKVINVHLDKLMPKLEKAIEKETGFLISNHMVEFFGLCKKCK